MVNVRVIHMGIEALADAPAIVNLNVQRAQVAFPQSSAGTANVRVIHIGVEVMGQTPVVVNLNIQRAQVGFPQASAGTANVRVIHIGVEVMASTITAVNLNIQRAQVGFPQAAVGTANVRVIRYGLELMANRPPTVTASANFPAEFDLFLHNWASRCRILNTWLTDVTSAARTVSEDRTSLRDKPVRVVELEWLIDGRERADLFIQHMRRLPRSRLALPLYPDQTPLLQDVVGSSDTIFCNTNNRRFFAGMFVMLAKVNRGDYEFEGTFLARKVDIRFNNRLVLTTAVNDLKAGEWLVFPVMETEILLEPDFKFITDYVLQAKLSVEEVIGGTTLPPLQTGNPDDFPVHEGAPVWVVRPDWKRGVIVRFLQEGQIIPQGKGKITVRRGERHRVIHEWRLLQTREEFWATLRLWDTMRGRARQLWQVDVEHLWKVNGIDASGNFIDFDPINTFNEFIKELGPADNGYVGIVFFDGTIHVRQVSNVTINAGNWRVTVTPALPVNLDATQVEQAGRARKVRFFSDELKEEWVTAETVEVTVETIEVLRELEVPIT